MGGKEDGKRAIGSNLVYCRHQDTSVPDPQEPIGSGILVICSHCAKLVTVPRSHTRRKWQVELFFLGQEQRDKSVEVKHEVAVSIIVRASSGPRAKFATTPFPEKSSSNVTSWTTATIER